MLASGRPDPPQLPSQMKECPACGAAMAFSDRHPCCIGCLGVVHALDACLRPSSCAICAVFGPERLRCRLDKALRGATLREGKCTGSGVGDSPRACGSSCKYESSRLVRRHEVPLASATFSSHHNAVSSGGRLRQHELQTCTLILCPRSTSLTTWRRFQFRFADVHMTSPRHDVVCPPEAQGRSYRSGS